MSPVWPALLAAGVFAGVMPAGSMLLSAANIRLADASRLAATLARVACGALAWSIALVLLAVCDAFHPAATGAAGWLLTGAWLVAWRRGANQAGTMANRGVPRQAWVVAAVLAAAALLYAGWPKESLVAERDEAIYTLHAMHLVRTGENRIDMAATGLAGSATAAAMASNKRLELPGIYPTGDRWTFQFSVLPSAWMAQMAATFGDAGLFRFNALLGVLSALAFLALLREWLPRAGSAWAVVATAAFALNPAQVWVSRVNLSEPLAQWFTLSGLLLALLAFRQGSARLAWLAGAVVGASVLVRIDALLTVLLLATAFPVAWVLRAGDAAPARAWLPLVGGATLVASASLGHYVLHVQPYWNDHARYLQPLLLVSLPLALAVAVASRIAMPRLPGPLLRALAALACVGLAALFGYAALLRPQVLPHSLLDSPLVPQLIGQRDYRELSLHNLAAYLGWPLLLATLGGYLAVIWRLGRAGAEPASVLLATVFLGVSAAFLWNPMISPDHVWASRRFVPVVIPGTLALAAWLLAHVSRRWSPGRSLLLASVLGVVVTGQMLWAQRNTLWVAEDRGLLASLRQLDAQLPVGQRLFVEANTLAATLLGGFGKDALPLLDGDLAQATATRDDIASQCQPQSPCLWLHSPGATRPGWDLTYVGVHVLPRQRIAGTPIALADEVLAGQWPLAIDRLAGLAPAAGHRRLGGHRDWRLSEEGFWHDEFGTDGTTRWTRGDARIRVPALPSRAIAVTLQSPPGVATALRLDVNGQVMFDGEVAGGRRTIEFAPPPAGPDGHWLFGIHSDRFVPAERYGGADQRRLGIKLESIRLLAETTAPAWSPDLALSADLGLSVSRDESGRPAAFLISVRNTGDWSWPSLADARPGEAPVQIGVLWIPRDGSAQGVRLLEQRLTLPHRLEPGEGVLLPLVLDPHGPGGAKLPAADYDVIVSPVLEGIAWFHDKGAAPLRIPVDAGEIP